MSLPDAGWFLAGYFALHTLTAAVSALPPPRSAYGWYAWLYAFARQETNMLDAWFSNRTRTPSFSVDDGEEPRKETG